MEPLLDKEVQTCRSQRGVKAMAVKDCASVPGTLTRGERQPLVQTGESEAVLDLPRLWQKVVRTSCSRAIEELTGGQVVGFMSDDHIDPDIAVGVLMLEPVGADPVAQAAIAVAE